MKTSLIAPMAMILLGSVVADAAPASPDPTPSAIPIEVLAEPGATTRDWPIATGLLLPEGELRDPASGALRDGEGRPVPFLAEATGWWNAEKTAVKWLLLRFKASAGQRYEFEPSGEPLRPANPPLAAQRKGVVTVNTGPLQATISTAHPALFASVSLHGRAMLAPEQPTPIISLANAAGETRTELRGWHATLEEATPLHASVKATGFLHSLSGWSVPGVPVAKLELRYEFFQGESFVRVYHTFTWMLSNFQVAGREISLGVRPAADLAGRARFGAADAPGSPVEAAWPAAGAVYALQDDARHFSIQSDTEVLAEGQRLEGWAAVTGQGGRGITLTLRHPWQTYPKAFAAGSDGLQVQLWPARSPSMSFTPLAIMTPERYYHPIWKTNAWTREQGHFVHERSRQTFYHYTAEGAARTHELTVHFHDASPGRTPGEVSKLTQRPLALRQEPASTMRVPFMGFRLMPVQREKFPDIERALDTLGRMATGRWAANQDYGMWRFGHLRWGVPPNTDNGGSMYRWMDGSQYDQTLIPWLLYLRGGDRQFLEEAEITSRFLMDVGVNHYNTRGFPTGYMATAGGTPFPYIPFHTTKGTKIHFLSYYYHLTGYKRAREVMQEVIDGTLATASMDQSRLPPWFRRTGGREAYNMNVFWVNAYHETWDPRLRRYAEEWKDLAARREYVPAVDEFRPPRIYLYNGLVLQQRLWQDPHLRSVMLRNLETTVLTDPASGRDRHVENAIGSQWAFEESGDRRYVEVAADLAQSLADSVPDMDFGGDQPPFYSISGNAFYRQFVLPILVGASLGREAGLTALPTRRRDTFFTLTAGTPAGRATTGTVLVRPRADGALPVFVRLARSDRAPVRVTARRADGREVARLELAVPEATSLRTAGQGYELLQRPPAMGTITIPAARRGETYRVDFEGLAGTDGVLVLADAQVAYQTPVGGSLIMHDLGGQYYGGARFVARAAEDVVTVESRNAGRAPYMLRDAATGEVLFRSRAGEAATQRHAVGAGRLLLFTVAARSPHSEKRITGIERRVAASVEDWFSN